MARAKVKVDSALRVVEIAHGNPEEMTVSQLPQSSLPQRAGAGVLRTGSWNLRIKIVSEPTWRVCGRPKTRPTLASRPLDSFCGFFLIAGINLTMPSL
jgi:hypothetical protein